MLALHAPELDSITSIIYGSPKPAKYCDSVFQSHKPLALPSIVLNYKKLLLNNYKLNLKSYLKLLTYNQIYIFVFYVFLLALCQSIVFKNSESKIKHNLVFRLKVIIIHLMLLYITYSKA